MTSGLKHILTASCKDPVDNGQLTSNLQMIPKKEIKSFELTSRCIASAFLNFFLIESFNSIPGQERFTSMTRVYYKGAAACVIMFDLTSQQTFNSTIKWKRDLDKKCTLPNGKTIPCILVGNKVSDKL